MRCLDLLEYRVSSDQKIQLHCFTGPESVVRDWLALFPNTYFSVSGLVFQFNVNQQRALQAIPQDHLLVETDAPYFPVRKEFPCSAPHLLDVTAQRIGELLGGMSMEDVMELTERNGKSFFQES
ncbi:deoxyribonuclease YabD [Mizuhopecten yessoensis]|uniref:Deoxyribonuclease YabD n=1 Tax=Mizuhopecten yessoensis TaxID=6573 RepID=A0A210PHK6_MIZYE|nr:deoxyribonuclease YabD [Mizuhopecten yessoensis]